jgi:hypothetical protein
LTRRVRKWAWCLLINCHNICVANLSKSIPHLRLRPRCELETTRIRSESAYHFLLVPYRTNIKTTLSVV